jgi:hypothetical protein
VPKISDLLSKEDIEKLEATVYNLNLIYGKMVGK